MDKNRRASQSHNLNVADLKAETVIFEVRFPTAYRLWDASGSFWTGMIEQWPELKNVEGSPARTVFSLADKFQLNLELDKAFCVAYLEKTNAKAFLEITQPFIEAVTSVLKIQSYTRIGLRQVFAREFPSKQEASSVVTHAGILHVPKSPQFGIEGSALLPEYALRWEGRSTGTTVRVRAEERKLDFEPALGVTEIEPVNITRFRVVLDVDYYATGTIAVEQLRVTDWVNQAQHLVMRDIDSFLEASE